MSFIGIGANPLFSLQFLLFQRYTRNLCRNPYEIFSWSIFLRPKPLPPPTHSQIKDIQKKRMSWPKHKISTFLQFLIIIERISVKYIRIKRCYDLNIIFVHSPFAIESENGQERYQYPFCEISPYKTTTWPKHNIRALLPFVILYTERECSFFKDKVPFRIN